MVIFLARHEWRVLTAASIVRAVLVAFVVALTAAAALGWMRQMRERQTFDRFTTRGAAARATSASMRADVVANDRGVLALLPPAPLGALAVGQSDVYSSYFTVTARNLDSLVSGDQIEHPLAVASGPLDLAFVVLFLYPLLILATSFDLTATERENGTLRMVLSHPVRLREVVAGKILARAIMLAAPVVAVSVIVSLAAGESMSTRLTIWMLAVLAYASIWHGLALLVNASGWNAAANALVLAGVWLLFVVVGPSAINLLIEARYPMPSRVEAAVQARAATQEAQVSGSRQLGQFLQDHPTSGNVGREGMRQFALLQTARDKQVAERMQAVDAAFNAQLQRQRRLASWLGIVSPTMVVQGVVLDAAGTGVARFEGFRDQVAAFQRRWQAYFEPRVLDAATLTAPDLAAAPVFEYRDEADADVLRRTVVPIVGLAAVGMALIAIGLRRYEGYSL